MNNQWKIFNNPTHRCHSFKLNNPLDSKVLLPFHHLKLNKTLSLCFLTKISQKMWILNIHKIYWIPSSEAIMVLQIMKVSNKTMTQDKKSTACQLPTVATKSKKAPETAILWIQLLNNTLTGTEASTPS